MTRQQMMNKIFDMEREIEMLEAETDAELEMIRQEEIAERRMSKLRNRLKRTKV